MSSVFIHTICSFLPFLYYFGLIIFINNSMWFFLLLISYTYICVYNDCFRGLQYTTTSLQQTSFRWCYTTSWGIQNQNKHAFPPLLFLSSYGCSHVLCNHQVYCYFIKQSLAFQRGLLIKRNSVTDILNTSRTLHFFRTSWNLAVFFCLKDLC